MTLRGQVRDHIPLEQGLRLGRLDCDSCHESVRDHIPLEQGLRRELKPRSTRSYGVRDHIPLEQGLRLGLLSGRRAMSIASETIFH